MDAIVTIKLKIENVITKEELDNYFGNGWESTLEAVTKELIQEEGLPELIGEDNYEILSVEEG